MLSQRTCLIFSIQSILNVCTEEKICSYPVPCSFRTWLIEHLYDMQITFTAVPGTESSLSAQKVGIFRENRFGVKFIGFVYSTMNAIPIIIREKFCFFIFLLVFFSLNLPRMIVLIRYLLCCCSFFQSNS